MSHPDLHIVRRELPEARCGKAAALNHAYAVLAERLGEIDRGNVVVAVVDADGRLDARAPDHVAAHFADPAVGGVQSLVRIYNRQRLLTWCQDVEFSVYGHLYQAGRNGWGTAGMGGNGQFNRLGALDDVADGPGPWRDRLTEDQDLGLRLIARGWKGRQELRATVTQQGLPSLRALLRQRTRWSQGNLQAIGLTGQIVRHRCRSPRASICSPTCSCQSGRPSSGDVPRRGHPRNPQARPVLGWRPTWQLLLFYALAFGGTILGCIAARRSAGVRGWLTGFLIGNVYALYTWLLWPVLLRSTLRQLTHQHAWSKTEREPIENTPSALSPGHPAGTPRLPPTVTSTPHSE